MLVHIPEIQWYRRSVKCFKARVNKFRSSRFVFHLSFGFFHQLYVLFCISHHSCRGIIVNDNRRVLYHRRCIVIRLNSRCHLFHTANNNTAIIIHFLLFTCSLDHWISIFKVLTLPDTKGAGGSAGTPNGSKFHAYWLLFISTKRRNLWTIHVSIAFRVNTGKLLNHWQFWYKNCLRAGLDSVCHANWDCLRFEWNIVDG